MKTRIINLVRVIAFFAFVTLVVSCSKDEIQVQDQNKSLKVFDESAFNANEIIQSINVGSFKSGQLKTAEITPDYCGQIKVFPLIASQKFDVGYVAVYNDVENLYVVYHGTSGFPFEEFHLFVGALEDLPINNSGAPVIGHFPYSSTESTFEKTFIIPLSELPECYVIAAHAVIGEHTIWGKDCENVLSFGELFGTSRWGWVIEDCSEKCSDVNKFTLKSLLRDTVTGSGIWTYLIMDGQEIINGAEWCSNIDLAIPMQNETYYLLRNNKEGMIYGHVVTTFEAGKLLVAVYVDEPNKVLERTHLFYGTESEFEAYGEQDGCSKYFNWPYLSTNVDVVQIIEVSIN